MKPGLGADESAEFGEDAVVDGGVADDAATAVGFLAARLELRFDEGDEAAPGANEGGHGRQDQAEGDERAIEDGQVEGVKAVAEGGGDEFAGVDALEDADARVLAEFPGQLAAADVDGRHLGGAVLEEAVGEPAGRGADVEGSEAADLEGEGRQGGLELVAAAADVAVAGDQFDRVLGTDLAAGFVGGVAGDPDLAGEDRALRLLAALAESAVDEQLIESHRGGQCARGRCSGAIPE